MTSLSDSAAASRSAEPAPLTRVDRRAAIILTGLMMGLLLGALDNTIVLTALGKILVDLNGSSPAELTFVVSAYLITQTIALPIFGKLSDLYGRRRFFLLGLVIFIAGSALSGLSQTPTELIVFRAVQGVGAGAFFPVALSIVGVMFTPQTRARLTGVFASVFGIASVVGPFAGSYIVDNLNWRWVFYVNLPIGLAAFALIALYLSPLRPKEAAKPFDVVGTALLAGWVAPLVFVLQEIANQLWTWSDPRSVALLVLSVALLVAFLLQEVRSAEPLLPLRYFRRRIIAVNSGLSLLRGVVLLGVSVFVTVFVDTQLHFGPSAADTVRDVLYGFVLPLVAGSMVSGRLLLRADYRPVVAAGIALMAFGTFLLSQATLSTPTWGLVDGVLPTGLVVFLVPVGFGIGLTFSPVILSVQYAVPAREIGTATSLVQFLGSLGGAIGIPVLAAYQASRTADLLKGGPPVGSSPQHWVDLATIHAVSEVFLVMLGLSLATLAISALLTGRLPRDPVAEKPAVAADAA